MESDKRYRFGNIIFRIVSPQAFKWDECIDSFMIEEGEKEDYIFKIYPESYLEDSQEVLPVYVKRNQKCMEVHIRKSLLSEITVANLVSAVNVAKLLPEKDEFVLHASYVLNQEKALLFCAPSGTGKSTQAEFWKRSKDAVIVNEDRVVIFQQNGIYYAGGCWATGKSRTCLNKTAPIHQIILLEQGEENRRVDLSSAEKFTKLIEQCSFSTDNMQICDKIISLVFDLIASVPVIGYMCINDISSVEELEKYL